MKICINIGRQSGMGVEYEVIGMINDKEDELAVRTGGGGLALECKYV